MNDDRIRKIVLDALRGVAPDAPVDELGPDDDIRDALDVDSMDHLNFVIALHEATGVDVPERDYPKLVTLSGCIAYLDERIA